MQGATGGTYSNHPSDDVLLDVIEQQEAEEDAES